METLSLPLGVLAPGTLGSSCAIAALAGLLSHVLYFIRGYHVRNTTRFIAGHLLAIGILFFWSLKTRPFSRSVVFTSMVVYQLFFHPLRHFPGPFMAKISKIYHLYISRIGIIHLEHRRLSEEYGDIVGNGRCLRLSRLPSLTML